MNCQYEVNQSAEDGSWTYTQDVMHTEYTLDSGVVEWSLLQSKNL